MNVLILGNGVEELAWAKWLRGRSAHRLDAAFPGFAESVLAVVPAPRDLDDALARPGVDVVIVGGPIEVRGESLRRAAAEGLAIICLHPPGADSEAYYQVALSRAETGAVIVPDLPLRLHPGVAAMRQAFGTGELGAFRGLRIEAPTGGVEVDLAQVMVPRVVDVVRALLGEIEALTATGDRPGEHPDLELIVQLRAPEARRAELRLWAGPDERARLSLLGASGSLGLEFDPLFEWPARLIRRTVSGSEESSELEPWDAHEAIFSVLLESSSRRESADLPHPNLLDATRAMEIAEATARSLRRGRTVDLHYEEVSEEATFKSVMTSTGCVVLLVALFILPIALGGPALGIDWTIYIAYLILPALVIFVVLQALRFAVRRPGSLEVAAKDQPRAKEPGN
jgi:myo-inositol 2-dehydrogenase/D-chiro-inositol 1-dehydrogenase